MRFGAGAPGSTLARACGFLRDEESAMRKPLDEAAIRVLASSASFERGRACRDDGAVSALVRHGDTLTAEVEGSAVEPYRVTVRIAEGAVAEARCTCAYEWGGACKHVVATLLSAIEAPGAVAERLSLDALVEGLDRGTLVALLLKRAALDPDLADWIESECAVRPGRPPDPAPIAARARAVLAERYRHRDYWDGYRAAGDADELRDLVEKAVPLLEAGDGRGALRVLEAVTDAFVDDWIDTASDTDEHLYTLFDDLARMMAEAALMSDLGEDEREAMAETAERWQEELGEYGAGEAFGLVVHALRTGWDAPGLQAVLAGEGGPWPPDIDDDALPDRALAAWEGDEEADALFDALDRERDLIAVRLRVLDAAGRHDAYLHFARAAAAQAELALMLVRLGRIDAALAHARATFRTPGETLALAQALEREGRAEEAFAVAGSGLSLAPPEGGDSFRANPLIPLARWLREAAAAAGRADLALEAARAAFRASLTPEDFRAARAPAGVAWDEVRRDLLDHLRGAGPSHHRVAILLDEGLIDEAVADAGEGMDHRTPGDVLLRLAQAAQARHPDWVIRLARRRAEPIMEQGQAERYGEAAEWLRHAALAHEAAGRIDEWSALIEGLIERHRRKYKLRPMLEALRF